MFRMEWLFLMQIVLGILMIIVLRKLTKMKKQIDDITKEVNAYINFITEEEQLEEKEQKHIHIEETDFNQNQKNSNSIKKKDVNEEQNDLIEAVLKEYFP